MAPGRAGPAGLPGLGRPPKLIGVLLLKAGVVHVPLSLSLPFLPSARDRHTEQADRRGTDTKTVGIGGTSRFTQASLS